MTRHQESICREVVAVLQYDLAALVSPCRTSMISWRRYEAAYVIRAVAGFSFPVIGRFFCRAHQPILRGCKLVAERMEASAVFRNQISELICRAREVVAKVETRSGRNPQAEFFAGLAA